MIISECKKDNYLDAWSYQLANKWGGVIMSECKKDNHFLDGYSYYLASKWGWGCDGINGINDWDGINELEEVVRHKEKKLNKEIGVFKADKEKLEAERKKIMEERAEIIKDRNEIEAMRQEIKDMKDAIEREAFNKSELRELMG